MHVGFSHRLLSIMGSPDQSRQPIADPRGTLVFNGSIYNFVELRKNLIARGETFQTDTDTEVLLKGLCQEGIGFCAKLRGMYAFAFFDKVHGQVLLVRDPFGTKPLYYSEQDRAFFFSSEYKAILPYLDTTSLDPLATQEYLRFRFVPGDRTLISEIKKVPANSALRFSLETSTYKIEKLPSSSQLNALSVEQALVESVNRRSVAHVEVAALLSGGIDSTIVCEILSRTNTNLSAYTLGTGNAGSIDETSAARDIASSIGLAHNSITPQTWTASRLDLLTYHLDDPYGDPIIMSLDEIFAAISGHHRVVLTGEGADELFSGYVHDRAGWLASRIPGPLASFSGRAVDHIPAGLLRRILPYSGTVSDSDLDVAKSRLSGFLAHRTMGSFLKIFNLFGDEDFQEVLADRADDETFSLAALRTWDRETWLTHSQLFKMDKISMKSAIEAREPYLDVDLFSVVDAIPARKHFGLTRDKVVLRETARLIPRLPFELIQRRKSSFFRPFNSQTMGPLHTECLAIVDGARNFLGEHIRPDSLNKVFSSSDSSLLAQKKIFSLACLGLWSQNLWSKRGRESIL